MSLPEGDEASLERLLSSDAVCLLSERAAAVIPGFAVEAGNARTVLHLCRRLDAIPLALELAAVRLGSLSLDQLNQGLASELSILGSGNRGDEARRQTLEATIGWSYRLLEEPEQLLWARLSIFAGGFDQGAAVEVCSDVRLPADRIPTILGALVEKSILKRQPTGDNPRYWLLETVRQYGRQQPRELGEETLMQVRHRDWIVQLSEAVDLRLDRRPEMFQRMYLERDNLWAALEYCLRQPSEVAAAVELARHLMVYWQCRGPYSEVRRILTSLAESTPEDSLPRARLLWVAATLAAAQNDYDACASLSQEN